MTDLNSRYSRQHLFAPIGQAGQKRIADARVLVIGCGALGTNIAELLARAGVGFLRIVDRDVVELSNLHRQAMFEESDARQSLPKATAAAARLSRINHETKVDAIVGDVNAATIEGYLDGIDLVMDGCDNFATRYLVNDACVKAGLPWVYGGAIGASGATMAFTNEGPCLSCVWPDEPSSTDNPTCDVLGVIGPTPALVAALQVTEALKIIVGAPTRPTLWHIELWEGTTASVKIAKNPACPVCGKREFRFLDAHPDQFVTTLCGQNAVQITPAQDMALDLNKLRETAAQHGSAAFNGHVLKASVEDGFELYIFPTGRVMVRGTTDTEKAKELYEKYTGCCVL